MLRAARPDVLLRGVSDAVGVHLSMQDRNGIPYVSVDISPLFQPLASADDGANCDTARPAPDILHGTGTR